jgi:ABC-type bacteriocin/lantibiotic exporter with double-glycine peptidase domain
MKKTIAVPHFAQYLDVAEPHWQERTCAIASLNMVLSHYGESFPVEELLEKGLELNGYIQGIGWKHDALVELARECGYQALRTEDDCLESLIASVLNDEPVIVSIYKNFDTKEGGHLAVLTGFFSDDKTGEVISFFINDPIGVPYKYKNQGIPYDVFMRGWKKRAIYVKKKSGQRGKKD